MPILNDLRLRQINEVLDYDKNMNKRAYEIALNNRQSYEQPQAQSQLNSQDIGGINELVDTFMITLERNELDKMLSTGSADVGKNIGLVEDVIVQYNRIVSVYLNPANTQQLNIFKWICTMEDYIL